jgi:hypothetical protein
MGNCPLCNLDSAQSSIGPKERGSLLGRAWRSAQWLFPTALLALMPKCPMCVAAYIALFTGVGISVSAARWLQISMLAVCIGTLVFLIARRLTLPRKLCYPISGRRITRSPASA